MGITYKEALEHNLISDKTIQIMPLTCDCGNSLEFTDSLKSLQCNNKNCINKKIDRLTQAMKKMNIQIEKDSLLDIINSYNIITPYQLFLLPSSIDISGELKKIQERKYKLYNIVEFCGIREIEVISKKLFNGFDSVEEAYNEIETSQVAFINDRLGVKKSDESILSVDIYNKLLDIKEELLFAETQLQISKIENKDKIRIAIVDNIKSYVNNGEFIEYLNSKFNKHYFVLITSVNSNTDIVIRNTNTIGSKTRAARVINDRYTAYNINKGEFTLSDVGKNVHNSLKPIGYQILICNTEELLDRLYNLYEDIEG